MSINEKGLLYVKPETISIEPDAHACSFNRLKVVRVEQEGGVVFLSERSIQKINDLLETGF